MKISIIYHSKTGRTKRIAEIISEGIKENKDFQVKLMNLDEIDYGFLTESKGVVFGTPTYYANISWQMKKWFDESWNCNLEGKIGAVFATGDYLGGGSDAALLTLINHMMVKGMLVYSGGSALGQPYIHMGIVALKDLDADLIKKTKIFGNRIASKALELFGDGDEVL
ncbi:flavodoxin family protein [Clostridium paridis]|uniref:Flavodoxin family protein n=1 Tax=Clostridium paridis TaxID=2803863 RepID=A0A937FI79_9CLOT|nr:flavodoxin domain-containing protein [Clostridium paridis]MBL4932026.1 flavodoxin family protein [Clostridium paridis]